MSSQQPSVPPAFVCAITTEVMNDPVTDRDGHSYERAAIEQWLAQNGTSPITRNAMTVNDLVPNRALCDAIVEWRAASGEAAPQRPHRVAAGQSPAATVPMPPASSATTTAAPVAVTLSVAPSQAVGEPAAANHQQAVMLTVTPPERRHQDNSGSTGGADRLPCDLICVLDTSGSMDDETFAKDADGSTEETGLSILDVVKHSVMTIAQMLGPKDRLAIVNFANNATSRPFVNMDDAGRAEVKTLLDTLKPEGGTNLWTGIQAGMDLARTSSRNCSVFVLTDGRPTSTPPRGYVPTLERALEEFQGPAPFTLSTFGFGYQLDAPLLDGLAKAGNGAFSFIPDGGLVGTVFVNAAANLLATYAQSARAKITLPEGFAPTAESLAAPGVTFDAARGTIVLELGAVQYGQARRHLLHIEASSGEGEGERPRFDPQAISCGVYLRVDGGQQAEVTARAAEACPEIAVEMHTQVGRNAFVRVVPTLTPTTQKELAALVAMLAALKGGATVTTASPLLHALWVDATGEVTLGATNANHGKWGRPYFLSIAAANQRQQCNNFKDKSVQCYGGALFLALQASGEKAFLSLPPPVSTCKKARSSALSFASYTATSTAPRPTSAGAPAASAAASGGKQPKSAAPAKPKKMDWAYNCGGGCIAPQCVVDLAGGEKKPAAAVAKGDVLANGAIVACVVRVKVGGRSGDDEKARRAAQFVALPGGLLVSEYHPVRLSDGEWAFPADVPSRAEAMVAVETTHMFSFLLEEDVESDASAATMRCVSAHGVDVAPFAHRCPSGTPVIGHDFFGSGASRRAIESAKGFADGNVEVTEMLRDAETKRIVGIVTAA